MGSKGETRAVHIGIQRPCAQCNVELGACGNVYNPNELNLAVY